MVRREEEKKEKKSEEKVSLSCSSSLLCVVGCGWDEERERVCALSETESRGEKNQ